MDTQLNTNGRGESNPRPKAIHPLTLRVYSAFCFKTSKLPRTRFQKSGPGNLAGLAPGVQVSQPAF